MKWKFPTTKHNKTKMLNNQVLKIISSTLKLNYSWLQGGNASPPYYTVLEPTEGKPNYSEMSSKKIESESHNRLEVVYGIKTWKFYFMFSNY